MAKEKRVVRAPSVGLLGLGLTGRGIATCLLGHGCHVVAYNRTRSRAVKARTFIGQALEDAATRKVLKRSRIAGWADRFRVVRSTKGLAGCPFVIESVREDLAIKRRLYDELEAHVAAATVVASNTSSFPIVVLQKKRRHPQRFLIMHWAEPAWITRFLEIVRNEETTDETVRSAEALALRCDKQPSVLQFDIRGFIANRLMYAFIREACYLADLGVADFATIDRSFRNDTGWWSALAGPFRWMDLTGIQAYGLVMKDLLPDLCDSGRIPKVMQEMLTAGATGLSEQNGFYDYDQQTAAAWQQAWVDFTFDIRKLVKKYEARLQRETGSGL